MHHQISMFFALSAALSAVPAAADPVPVPADHPVLELRQYKLTPGAQSQFVALFDREFVDTQEALGMRLVGQFHDHDRPDRFTWIRQFPNMAVRQGMLQSFYFGPVWAKWKGVANPMLDDNDNVLLLRPARDNSAFGPPASRAPVGGGGSAAGTVFAVIQYLWKDPNEGYSAFFLDKVAPLLGEAGLPVLGVYVPEEQPNNFPRLPVRSEKRLLVWFTRAPHLADFARIDGKLRASAQWKRDIEPTMSNAEERPAQVLRLDATPRSALR